MDLVREMLDGSREIAYALMFLSTTETMYLAFKYNEPIAFRLCVMAVIFEHYDTTWGFFWVESYQ